jgi:ribose transport system ATP-binding protein
LNASGPLTASAAGASTVDALVVEGLSKRFGGALALNNVDLSVRQREVHGLLGSNGSGKSTLIKILAGFHAPEPGGRVRLFGHDVPLPIQGHKARSLGLAFVHQNLGLIPSLSLTENLRLIRLSSGQAWRISWRREHDAAAEVFARYGLRLDPRAKVGSLSAVEQALFAIVRAVEDLRSSANAHVGGGLLVLDEPTPFLPRVGVEQLFALVRQVVAEGASVIFVSHDIAEVMEITDRATVLRDGMVVGTLETRSASHETFVERIIGRTVVPFHSDTRADNRPRTAIRVEKLVAPGLGPVSLEIGKGEIVGVTGLIGSGFDRICASIYGAAPAQGGRILFESGAEIDLSRTSPKSSLEAGVAYLPADRLGAAGVGELSVVNNVMLPLLDQMRNSFGLDHRRMIRSARELGAEFGVKPNIPLMPLGSLSGGNQQKALMAKWLQTKPKLILLDEPTQGVDVGARQQLLAALDAASSDGASILLASTDYEQLAQICHRVVVFARGQATIELTGSQVTKDTIAEHCYHSMTSVA